MQLSSNTLPMWRSLLYQCGISSISWIRLRNLSSIPPQKFQNATTSIQTFGAVETNGRGMLHLHCLIWLKGIFHLATLRQRLLSDPEYSHRIAQYLDHIIRCSIISDKTHTTCNLQAPSAFLDKLDTELAEKLAADSNAVASKCQMHSTSHNATCFKYGAAATGKCRFNFPRPFVDHTHVTNLGDIEIRCNNGWVNSWNAAFASLILSNHDITYIPSTIKALALVRYITNYATKGDCDQYQRALAFAIARKALECFWRRPRIKCPRIWSMTTRLSYWRKTRIMVRQPSEAYQSYSSSSSRNLPPHGI